MTEPIAGEAVIPKDPVEDDTTVPLEDPSKDPLDAIEDEEARALAKKERAITYRRTKRENEVVPSKEEEKVPEPTNYATKDDLKSFATRDAKNLVAPEVLEVWDELTKIPLGGFDPMDANAMAKNMTMRYTLYLQDNPVDAGDNPNKDLTTSPATPPAGSGPKPKAPVEKPLPGYKEPQQPEDWYGKKE